MVDIHVFGSSSPVGMVFCEQLNRDCSDKLKIYKYSRKSNGSLSIDLINPDSKLVGNNRNSIIISYAPIWDLASFVENIKNNNEKSLENINAIIAISSTSTLTKRYAFNDFDKKLVFKLSNAEKKLISISKNHQIKLKIIRPTMIYGKIKDKSDKNISKILKIMRFLPFVIVPNKTGLRQPIHIDQLAAVTIKVTKELLDSEKNIFNNSFVLDVGGDHEISYHQMVTLIKQTVPITDKARKCKIIKLPNFLFYIMTFPIIFFSTKTFESILRIQSNLNGFTPSHKITNTKAKLFSLKNIY